MRRYPHHTGGSCHTRNARRDPSQARGGVPCQLERPRQARRPRCDDHVHCPAWRDDVALLDIRPVLPAANRLAPEVVLVVQIRIKREEDPIGAPVGEAAALHETKVSDVVGSPVPPRDDERGLATGGQRDVLRQDGVEDDVLATVRLAEDAEMAREALGEREAGLPCRGTPRGRWRSPRTGVVSASPASHRRLCAASCRRAGNSRPRPRCRCRLAPTSPGHRYAGQGRGGPGREPRPSSRRAAHRPHRRRPSRRRTAAGRPQKDDM